MCVIVYKPTNAPLPDKQTLTACALQNPDGFGLATFNGERHIYKNVSLDPENVADVISEKVSASDAALIHFRLATHGSVTLANAHPFAVPGSDLVMMHNGILRTGTLKLECGKGTDSEAFARQYLARIVHNSDRALDRIRASNGKIRDLLHGDKLALMDTQGKVRIVNHAYGTIINRCWYSNTHWQKWDYEDNWTIDDGPASIVEELRLWDTLTDILADADYSDSVSKTDFYRWIDRVGFMPASDMTMELSPIDLVCEILGLGF